MTDTITPDSILTPEKIALHVANSKASIFHEEGDLEAEFDPETERKLFRNYLEKHQEMIGQKKKQKLEKTVEATSEEDLKEKLAECYIAVRNLLIRQELEGSEDDGLAE